jgi:hypothetical protein
LDDRRSTVIVTIAVDAPGVRCCRCGRVARHRTRSDAQLGTDLGRTVAVKLLEEMNSLAITVGHATLGIGALGWTAFLLPRTGLIWWVAGNGAYAALALTVATSRLAGRLGAARSIAIAGPVLFVTVNGAAAVLACRGGGACGTIAGIGALFLGLQTLLVVMDR